MTSINIGKSLWDNFESISKEIICKNDVVHFQECTINKFEIDKKTIITDKEARYIIIPMENNKDTVTLMINIYAPASGPFSKIQMT